MHKTFTQQQMLTDRLLIVPTSKLIFFPAKVALFARDFSHVEESRTSVFVLFGRNAFA